MNRPHVLAGLTLINLVLLAVQVVQTAEASNTPDVLRARAFELVDEEGRVRSQLSVVPASTTTDGTAYPETVIFRLITADGKPRVKLTTATEGSGILLLGASDTTYARLGANGDATELTRLESGRPRTDSQPPR